MNPRNDILVTSLTMWILLLYFSIIFVQDIILGWATHLVISSIFIVFHVVKSLIIPPAGKESVASFFRTDFPEESQIPVDVYFFTSSQWKTNNINTNSILRPLTIIGHRGAGWDAPENSISAFRNCKDQRCTAIKFDVAVTKDNVAVVFNDDKLLQIGFEENVKDLTYDNIRYLDISIDHPLGKHFRGERIPTLEVAVKTCLSLGLKFIIDLKGNDERVIYHILKTFKTFVGLYQFAAISSFSPKIIFKIRRQDPQIIGCLEWRPGFHYYKTWNSKLEDLQIRHTSFLSKWWDAILDCINDAALKWIYWWFLGLSVYLVDKGGVTTEWISYWRKKGIRIYLCLVNCPIEKLLLDQSGQVGYVTETLKKVNTAAQLLHPDSE